MHLCQWKSDLYRNSDSWRWVFKVFKRSRKPTAEKSTTENPRRKRPIFVMENIFCRKVGIQSTDEIPLKGLKLYASFRFAAIRFDAPTLLSFSGFTHAHVKCPPVTGPVNIFLHATNNTQPRIRLISNTFHTGNVSARPGSL